MTPKITNLQDDYCRSTTQITGLKTIFDIVDVGNGRTRKDYKICVEKDTLESYILKQIKEIESKLNAINKKDYSEKDFNAVFSRLSGQKDILYQTLTAHDNTYCSK